LNGKSGITKERLLVKFNDGTEEHDKILQSFMRFSDLITKFPNIIKTLPT